jgi:HSP20 family molecular chaperone IbpA
MDCFEAEVKTIDVMKTRKFVSDELLASIDVLNTLSGGVSEPQTTFKQFQDHREIQLKVPGVKEENMKVEIHNNMLSVFYNFHLQSDSLPIQVPKVVYNKPVPYFVDAARITATYENGFLIVTLPYNEMAEGYHRKVSIDS